MIGRMGLVVGALLMLTGLSACDDLPDYRYKMTVHVRTPAGDRAYSSVRGIHSEYVSSIMSSSGRTINDTLTGEAVVMDLPDGRTVYGLLSRPDNPEYATYVTGPALGPHIPRGPAQDLSLPSVKGEFVNDAVAGRKAMLALKGAYDLPRTVTHNPSHRTDYKPEPMWPLFVTFDDPARPASVREVSPDSVGVRNITIEITNDPVSKGIAYKLPWLVGYRKKDRRLSGSSSIAISSNYLKENLDSGAFIQGESK